MDEKIIEIPGVGNIAFPANMSDDDIAKVIKEQIIPKQQSQQIATPAPQTAQPAAPAQPSSPSFYYPQKVSQPNLQYERAAEMAASPEAALRAGTQLDKRKSIAEFAKARGIPTDRYRVVDGEIVFMGDDGKYYAEVPGMLKAPLTSAAYYAPDVLEAAPSIAAGIATAPAMVAGPMGAAASMGITGATAAGANYLRQQVAGLLSGEETDVDPFNVIQAGALGTLGQAIPAGGIALRNRNVARDIGRINQQDVDRLTAIAREQGIDLTPAELTNLPSLKSQQKVLGNIPESSDTLGAFYTNRFQKQVQPAVDDFLSKISKVDDPTTAGYRGQMALRDQLDNLKAERTAAVEPIYQSAFQQATPVNVAPVLKNIDDMLRIAKGEEKRTLSEIRGYLTKEVTTKDAEGNIIKQTVPEDRLDALQRAKFAIDSKLESDAVQSMDKVVQGDLMRIKKTLVDRMGENNPMYLEANSAFEAASEPIRRFAERKTGTSLINVSQDNLNDFANRVFANASPQQIRYVKQQITAQNPKAWDDVTRSYLQQEWERAIKPVASATDEKIDAGLNWRNTLMGDVKKKEALRTALSPEQFQALTDLTDVLQAAGRVKKIGSDTAFNQRALQELQGDAPEVMTSLARVAGGLRLDQPLKFVADWATKRSFAKNAESLADIITSPDAMSKLKQLKKMSPTSPKYWSLFSQVVMQHGATPYLNEFFADYGYAK